MGGLICLGRWEAQAASGPWCVIPPLSPSSSFFSLDTPAIGGASGFRLLVCVIDSSAFSFILFFPLDTQATGGARKLLPALPIYFQTEKVTYPAESRSFLTHQLACNPSADECSSLSVQFQFIRNVIFGVFRCVVHVWRLCDVIELAGLSISFTVGRYVLSSNTHRQQQ